MELTIDQALQQAIVAHKSGRLPEAEQLYKAILQTAPKHPDANHNLGILTVSEGKPDAALPFLKTALEANPKQGQFWISFIDALVRTNQLDAARRVLQQGKQMGLAGDAVSALAQRLYSPVDTPGGGSHNVEAPLAAAIALRETGKYDEARQWLDTWLSSHPRDSEAWSLLSQVYVLDKKDAEAATALMTARSIDPQLPSVYRNQARLLLKEGKFAEALHAVQSAHEKSSNDPETWLVLAACLRANRRDQESLVLVEKVLQARPRYAEAFATRAMLRLNAKDITGAVKDTEIALSIKPHLAQLWELLGTLRHQNKDLTGAIEALKKAHDRDPSNVTLMINLGEYLRQHEKLDEAIPLLEKATSHAPHNSDTWTNLGVALQQANRIGAAKAAYEKALSINAKSAEISSNLGALAKDEGDWEAALRHFEQALEIKPGSGQILINKGTAQEMLGRGKDARASFLQALELEPNSPDVLYALAVNYYYANDLAEAIGLLQKLAVVDPANEGLRANLHLSLLHYASGSFDSSQRHHAAAAAILQKMDIKYKNDRVYWKYLGKLLAWRMQHAAGPSMSEDHETLYVIGESHSLSASGMTVIIGGAPMKCAVEWIMGCKQWHLGNATPNKYKEKFEAIVSRLPQGARILLAIGEIDCRHDGGIMKHSRRYPEKSRDKIIETTVNRYLDYVAETTRAFKHRITIQGVPCPNVSQNRSPAEMEDLVELVKIFDSLASKRALSLGFDYLDVHALTDRGDGHSNETWHIDEYHLSPAAIAKAWSEYQLRAGTA